MSLRLIMLGPPGAGKGTQAQRLTERLGPPQISTGDMLRAAIREGNEVGRRAKGFIDQGQLVPDDLILELVGARLRQPDADAGYILDGFPRTIGQAEALERYLARVGKPLDHVIRLDVDDSVLVERLSGRRTCTSCGAMFHLRFNPPAKPGVCSVCGGALEQRSDDVEAAIRARLQVYREQTAPLVQFYRERGLLREVDGSLGLDEVFGHIRRVVGIDPPAAAG